ncbi:hypothetical protein OS493_036498 [Desmophyllum pertusum]|uniref:Uncharacterized protein n=1 Tax=Desmophyllum pertusum TaxID=174260 RepID=A0A9W9ZWB2_9CNID|nr:hypothetical protein OS493_036498 [Desmophyllum pertusum]
MRIIYWLFNAGDDRNWNNIVVFGSYAVTAVCSDQSINGPLVASGSGDELHSRGSEDYQWSGRITKLGDKNRLETALIMKGTQTKQCGAGPYIMTSSQEKSSHCTPGMRAEYVIFDTTGAENKKLESLVKC